MYPYGMEIKLEQGQEVKLLSSQGVITRIVVSDLGDVVLVCLPDEFQSAVEESRAPIAVGFRKSDVLPAGA